ncbi:MAG: hypothetical protein WC292_06875 [Clostridia bacterium]
MKKDYIKLYVDNVVARLPQKDREEVRKELNANIYDMLSEHPDYAEIKVVLEGLGSPKTLAEKYRTNPRYLISPAIFDNYIKVLLIGVPIAAILSAFAAFMIALVGIISNNVTDISDMMSELIGEFVSALYSGAIYAAVMITLGFIIYEHTNKTIKKEKPKKWEIENLKDVNLGPESISLTSSVASIVVIVCISVFFMLLSAGILPNFIWIKHNGLEVYSFFSKEFFRHCLYIIPILATAGIFTDILKIKYRKWTKGILYSVIVTSVIYVASFIFIFMRPQILSVEFIEFLKSLPVDSPVVIDSLTSGRGIAIVTISIVVIISLISIGQSVYQLLRMKKDNTV